MHAEGPGPTQASGALAGKPIVKYTLVCCKPALQHSRLITPAVASLNHCLCTNGSLDPDRTRSTRKTITTTMRRHVNTFQLGSVIFAWCC